MPEKKKSDADSRASSPSRRSDGHSSRTTSPRRAQSSRQQSPRRRSTASRSAKIDRSNKIYRCPDTPPPDDHIRMEKSFVLDSVAVSSVSNDYSKTNPKLGSVLRPYNSQGDRAVEPYFQYDWVQKTLRKTGQDDGGTSTEGKVADRFHVKGAGFTYLVRRNKDGAGHSVDAIRGHGIFLTNVAPVSGYNGEYGFRRNTPWLRATPSPFGTGRSPTQREQN